jgi:V/A-type H+/Na+-transporting ATPase subunit F
VKFFVIGDRETVTGFRLVGVDGHIATERDEVLSVLSEVVAKKEAGVVLITERVASKIRDEVEKRLYGFGFPLMLEIPDASGPDPGRLKVEDVVRRAIGISI